MKRILSITFAIWCLTPAVIAQGTFLFQSHLNGGNVVPPHETAGTAFGEFTLQDLTLDFWVRGDESLFFAEHGSINGPSSVGSNGPLIFDLGKPEIIPPLDGLSGGFHFYGPLTLSSQQAADLQSGLWYMIIRDDTGAEIRGQILPIPEPSIFALAGLGTLMLLLRFRKRHC